MSWSFSVTQSRDENDLTAFRDLAKRVDRTNIGNGQAESERDAQIDAAIEVAQELFESPIFSNAEKVTVNLSGHANPGHKLQSGWSNDVVNISIYIRKYKE